MINSIVISLVCGVVLGIILMVFPKLKKKGIDAGKALDATENVIKAADPIIDIVNGILPGNPAISVLEILKKWGPIAAGYAQQLCHAGDINKEDRAATAENVVYGVLKELKIDVDDNKKLLIDAVIKNTVDGFGHTPIDLKQLQDTIDKQKAQNAQLQEQNEKLNNTIATISSAAQTVQTLQTA